MDKKGENMGGTLIVAFVAIILGITLFVSVAQIVGDTTNTYSINENFTAPANDTAYYFTNYKSLTGVTIKNASNSLTITSGNYTITNNVVYNGAEAVKLVPDATAGYAEWSWNVVGTVQPLTYIGDSAGRNFAALIPVFAALAIAIVALTPSLRSGILDLVAS